MPPERARRPNRPGTTPVVERGLTLLELLVLVAIGAIIVSFLLP
ncbi:MAG: hypothetical protein SFX74_05255 [Fimbriimonadaceae bacterium]|nr:hypothetical protein [Fimbriimonadaceae bacterium]